MNKEEEDAFLKILLEFSDTVDPMTLLLDLPCLSRSARKNVVNSQTGAWCGSSEKAALRLHGALAKRPEGFREIVLALRRHNHDELADKLDPRHQIQEKDTTLCLEVRHLSDMPTGAGVNMCKTTKTVVAARQMTEPNIGSPGYVGGPRLSLSEQFQQPKPVISGQTTTNLPAPTWSMSQRPTWCSTNEKSSIHDSYGEPVQDVDIANNFGEDSDSDNNNDNKENNKEAHVAKKCTENTSEFKMVIVETELNLPKSPADELLLKRNELRNRVFEEKIANDNNIEHMHSELFPSTSTTGIGSSCLSSVGKIDVKISNEETLRQFEVNEGASNNNSAKEKGNTKTETRGKYSCENYIDHSLEDKHIHVPEHVESDTELDSIREKGKNKDLPGFRESQDLDSAENKGHDSVFAISSEDQSASSSTILENQRTDSPGSVWPPNFDQPRDVTVHREHERRTNNNICENVSVEGQSTETRCQSSNMYVNGVVSWLLYIGDKML
ncbi:uncharacterized protein LOC128211371 [Mya arenaria]|nr:uncharacterized protein LOC128211371 [Mya arenaria]